MFRKLSGLTLFITGGSRGIGKAIALKAARDGANIVIAAKTAEPHPKLPGTIYTAAKESKLLKIHYKLLLNYSKAKPTFSFMELIFMVINYIFCLLVHKIGNNNSIISRVGNFLPFYWYLMNN